MVTNRSVIFLIAVAILVTALLVIAAYSLRRARRSSRRDWESLLKRLTAVNRGSISEVALVHY